MTRAARDTPMMRQFLSVKARHPDAIVFYRMGDFYEMFLSDAEIAAPILDIALTTRDRDKEDAVPMCGIPVHSADPHIKRLAELGYRVAICEQVTSTTCEALPRRSSIWRKMEVRVIAEIMAWEEDTVAKIIRRYVDRSAATRELIRKLDLAKGRT